MWFTKDTTGFRGWFTVTDNSGSLRTGLVAGDFTVTIVDSADTASSILIVTESAVKPGSYYFDVPSAFLTTNGIGDYGIIVEIDTFAGPSGAPNVRGAFEEVLSVYTKDFEDIAPASQITDIETALNNVENVVTDTQISVDTIFNSLISDQFIITVGTGGITDSVITTDATLPDDVFNGQLGVFTTTIGTSPVIVARTISDYSQTDGTFTVSPSLPFVPNDGDSLVVLARTATAAVDNNAIATAVWTIASSPTVAGSYGELVNIMSNQTSLIPGLI